MERPEMATLASTIAGTLAAIPATASAVAAYALVGVTKRYTQYMKEYTEHTQRMVEEMRSARAAQVMPRLLPMLKPIRDDIDKDILVCARVVNVGTGPAFEVAVELASEPAWQTWRCSTPVMMPGEAQDFIFTAYGTTTGEHRLRLDAIVQRAFRLRLTGTCKDALASTLKVDEVLDITTLAEHWRQAGTPEFVAGDQPLADIAEQLRKLEQHRFP